MAKEDAIGESSDSETLVYVVPPGQDPVPVATALESSGFPAVSDTSDGRPKVIVNCPNGSDESRPAVRDVIQGVHTSSIEHGTPVRRDRVVFGDEREPPP